MKNIVYLLMLFSAAVFAGKYPVVVGVTVTPQSYDNWQYSFNQKIVEIGSAADQIPTSGALEFAGKVYEGLKRPSGYAFYYWQESGVYADGKRKAGDMALEVYEKYGKTINTIIIGGAQVLPYPLTEPDACFGYGIVFPNATKAGDSAGTIWPAGCTHAPPANLWCKITTPEIHLDHGSVTLQDSEGDVAKTKLDVNCTSSMAVKFSLATNEPYVYLAPTGKSEIKIEDQALGGKINMQAGINQLTVSDMLSGVSTEGVNSGSSVLVMMPY